MYNASFQFLQFAKRGDCPTTACPVQEYLLSKNDVLDWVESSNKTDDSESRTEVGYKLKLETEDIGKKFVEVYNQTQIICEQCRNQSLTRG